MFLHVYVFLRCFYMFLHVSTCFYTFLTCFCMFLHVYMFLTCFYTFPTCFFMFLHASVCFCMFLYVSTSFYVSALLYMFPVAPSFVLGSNPKFQGCFPPISGGPWSWERAADPCALPLSLCFPQPPKRLSHLGVKSPARRGILGERKTLRGCDAGHVLRQVGEVPDLVCPCAEDLLCVWWDEGFHPTTGMQSSAFLESLESPHSSRAASSPLWRKFPGWVWVFQPCLLPKVLM